jgi:hypothetical protein
MVMVAFPSTASAAPGLVAKSPAAVGGWGPAGLPSASDGGDRMASFKEDILLDKDGGATITETIDYRFGTSGGARHGIYRNIVVRQAVEGQGEDTYRYYSLSDVSVTSPTGAPTTVKLGDRGSSTQIRVGDPDQTITGPQTYVISYHLANVMNPFEDHAEYFANIFKDDAIPKDTVRLTLNGPGGVTEAKCSRGNVGEGDPCDTAEPGSPATFTVTGLKADEDLTIATKLPRAGFGELRPDLRSGGSSMDAGQAKLVSALALTGGVAVPIVAAGLMGTLVATRGRDEWYSGLTPGLTPGAGGATGGVGATGIGVGDAADGIRPGAVVRGATPTVAVQFNPPPGVQPGMVGTIIDEEVNTVDVSATVVDLAVRGFLRIEEIPSDGRFSRTDWRLTRLVPQPGETLRRYEATILEGIFEKSNPVNLSELKYHFADTLKTAKAQMYDEVVERGWFRKSPQTQRAGWQALGMVLVGAGLVSLFYLGVTTHGIDRTAGLRLGIPSGVVLGIGLIVGGLIFRLLGKRMAAKTAEGSAMLAQALGFKQYLVTAEAGQIRVEEAQSIFSRYLPYAIVFGVADRWASTFQQVAEAAAAAGTQIMMPTWYLYSGAAFRAVVDRLVQDGARVVEAAPDAPYPTPLWNDVALPEGFASEGHLLERWGDRMAPGTRDIVEAGRGASAKDYLDALQRKQDYGVAWGRFFEDHDVLLTPSMPLAAFGTDVASPASIDGVPVDPFFDDWCALALPANLTGCPACAVPTGFDQDGLPLGLQVMGPRFADARVLAVAAAVERLAPWADRWPPVRSR